jgi:hypothetical protein
MIISVQFDLCNNRPKWHYIENPGMDFGTDFINVMPKWRYIRDRIHEEGLA